ncbi:hypothetical protein LTR78_010434 [Recurvomyces mirabilis]|uniref:Malic acid transport protein n=1 Tax=Recurvomyces mirabilis TaxID=574656 RepID=A0AAE0WGW0_9PEZI|nr:hypothetical protein LTR78_010434 [Recurvomyces mirabilis]KAK5150512.1 hypothetical protein LTS14_010005 [Recurvomyces mirabilis]
MASAESSSKPDSGFDQNGNEDTKHDIERDGNKPEQTQESTGIRDRLAAIVEDFSFLWFTLSMNTGILSILMHQLPYQFRGLGILSTIMFVFNLALFILFFCIFLLRVAIYPKALVKSCSNDLTELALTGAVPIAWFTLLSQVGITVSTASWGAHAFFLVAYVMWWIGTAVMLTIATLVIVVISKTDITTTEKLTPGIVIPFVGTTTNAVVGALIVNYSDDVNTRLAIPVIIVGYMLTGIGTFAALILYSAYFIRMTNIGLPPPAQRPGLVMLVGPCGQGSAALQLLGTAAKMHFGKYGKGTIFTDTAGEIFSAAGTLLGLMLTGMSVLFTTLAVYCILETAFKRQCKYSLLWWSTIFPMATVCTAFISFAKDFDSPAFRVLATGLFLILLIDYFINWGFTIRDIVQGKLLNGKRSPNPAANRVKRH